MCKKVLVAMSGGVDSSVAVAILVEQKYDVMGVTLKLFEAPEDNAALDAATGVPVGAACAPRAAKTCCSLEDVEDARSVANSLAVPYHVFNFKEYFNDAVIQPFVKSYMNGETPNPCIECNRAIKFEKLLERAVTLGQDFIATGHYAKIEFDEATGRYLLKKPRDATKDQTYALYNLTQYQLSRTLFPLGDLRKTEVRAKALELNLQNASKSDSQEICFVTDNDYGGFISASNSVVPGDFLDTNGVKIGTHKGIVHYTIGQRKGLGLSAGRPVFVVAIDAGKNTVTIGSQDDLLATRITASDVNLISVSELREEMRVNAKIRYRAEEVAATIYPLPEGEILVVFEEPVRAATAGQAVVFYDGDVVVGGGKIQKVEK